MFNYSMCFHITFHGYICCFPLYTSLFCPFTRLYNYYFLAYNSQVEQSYKILHSSCIYLARQIGRYLTRILQIARKCTQNEAFLARLGYILARSCTNLAITACKNCILNGRHARINGSCKVLQDSLQEFIAKNHVEILACKCILLARSIYPSCKILQNINNTATVHNYS